MERFVGTVELHRTRIELRPVVGLHRERAVAAIGATLTITATAPPVGDGDVGADVQRGIAATHRVKLSGPAGSTRD